MKKQKKLGCLLDLNTTLSLTLNLDIWSVEEEYINVFLGKI